MTIQAVAERVGLSASPCLRRIRQLESEGLISAYSAVVDQKARNTALRKTELAELQQKQLLAKVRATITSQLLHSLQLAATDRELSTKIAQPADPVVPAGETRHFAIAILDPPGSASQLEVAFAPEAARKGCHLPKTDRPAHGPVVEAPVLRDDQVTAPGVAPVEAQPLPSSSPYALPTHE